MAYENLRLQEPNCVRVGGYFYHITEEADALFKLTDDGTVAFSYPLDTDIQNPVVSIEHDGFYWWTLENPAGYDIIIRKFAIEDYVARQVRAYSIVGSITQKFDSNAFAIEHFDYSLLSVANAGSDTAHIGDTSRIKPGHRMNLGPSTFPGDEGVAEQKVVLQTISGTHVQFTTNLSYTYNPTDSINVSIKCWVFNKYRISDPEIDGSGQLYSFDIFDVSTYMDPVSEGNEYRDVAAATFLVDPVVDESYLVFMNQTNLLFIDTDPDSSTYLDIIKSATQNNQEDDTTVIPVYEITHEGYTLFRLQRKATFRVGGGINTEDWDEYNYQLSTLQRLPQSISLVAASGIISADGVSTTDITATVKDQFDAPVSSRTVDFSEDDSSGSPEGVVNPGSATTNSDGEAVTTYRAGTEPKVVKITAET